MRWVDKELAAHEDFLGFYNVPDIGAETPVGYKRCDIKFNSFIVIIAFSVTLEKLNRYPQASPPPPPTPPKKFLHAFFFSAPTRNLATTRNLWASVCARIWKTTTTNTCRLIAERRVRQVHLNEHDRLKQLFLNFSTSSHFHYNYKNFIFSPSKSIRYD